MFERIVMASLGVLVLVGVWSLYAYRLSATGGRDQLFVDDVTYLTREDFQDPARLLDPSKAANVLIAALELLLLVIATFTVLVLATRVTVPDWYVATAVGALLVGGYLLCRAIYVRLGFAVPETSTSVDDFGEGFERVAGTGAATDFAAIHDAMGRARGTDDSDAALAAVLAAARSDVEREELRTWAAESGLASPASVDERVESLADAGVLDPEAFSFTNERLTTADPTDVAAVATTAAS